jgi:hypothetical protein
LINNIKIKRGFMQGIIKHQAAALVLSLCLSVFSSAVYAQNQVCDPDYMDTLKQRAWMQAQREIELNANLITKPDSVLKLTCFDQFLNHAAGAIGPMFSGTGSSAPVPLQDALTAAVSNSLTSGSDSGYISNGFEYNLVGGASSYPAELQDSVELQSYGTCYHMDEVWNFVQCTNMDPNALFPDLEAFATGKDKRRNPKQCAATPPDTQSGWKQALKRMQTRYVASKTKNYFDSVKLFRSKWAPQNEVGDCADGIPTGVQVIPSSGPPYDEKICPNPGCYYSGGPSGNCQPIP